MKGTTYREEEISEFAALVLQRLDTCLSPSLSVRSNNCRTTHNTHQNTNENEGADRPTDQQQLIPLSLPPVPEREEEETNGLGLVPYRKLTMRSQMISMNSALDE